MAFVQIILFSLVLGFLLLYVLKFLSKRAFFAKRISHLGKLPLPPGPKSIPLLGNALQIPKTKQWETFADWADQHGDIMHISILSRNIIIPSSLEHCHNFLDNRSSIYSDRPILPMCGKLVGFYQGLTMSQEGSWHREVRKSVASSLNSTAVKGLQSIQEEETLRFLSRLRRQPERLRTHVRHFASSLSLRVAYGYITAEEEDPMVATAEGLVSAVSLAAILGKWLVDSFPILLYLPSWAPGAGFKTKAKAWRRHLLAFYASGFEWVESRLREGNAPRSHLADRLSSVPPNDYLTRDVLRHSAVAMYGGGTDTLSSTLETFFLYMLLNPDVQSKAQHEIDSAIGLDHLSIVSDRPRLPYTEAILKECLRILPVTPLGAPHRLRAEDTYMGYRIPKDAIVYTNTWRMMHDPRIFDHPHAFRPERHLDPRFANDPAKRRYHDPTTYAFGFGRRVCPGQHLAESTEFLVMAATLASFEIRKVEGKDWPEVGVTTGAFNHPVEFEYELVPRSRVGGGDGEQEGMYRRFAEAQRKPFRPTPVRWKTTPG